MFLSSTKGSILDWIQRGVTPAQRDETRAGETDESGRGERESETSGRDTAELGLDQMAWTLRTGGDENDASHEGRGEETKHVVSVIYIL